MLNKIRNSLFILLVALSFREELVHAQQLPGSVYTIDKLFYLQFQPLRSYMNKLVNQYPVEYGQNIINVFSKENPDEIHFVIKHHRITKDGYMKDTLSYFRHGLAAGKITFEQWDDNPNVNSFVDIVMFNYRYVEDVAKFKIDFVGFDVTETIETDFLSNGIVRKNAMYGLYGGSLKVFINELDNSDQFHSQLYYQCDVCSGDKIKYTMNKSLEHYGDINYFLAKSTVPVTPKEFYTKVNRSYLSGIYRNFSIILTKADGEFNWAWVE